MTCIQLYIHVHVIHTALSCGDHMFAHMAVMWWSSHFTVTHTEVHVGIPCDVSHDYQSLHTFVVISDGVNGPSVEDSSQLLKEVLRGFSRSGEDVLLDHLNQLQTKRLLTCADHMHLHMYTLSPLVTLHVFGHGCTCTWAFNLTDGPVAMKEELLKKESTADKYLWGIRGHWC